MIRRLLAALATVAAVSLALVGPAIASSDEHGEHEGAEHGGHHVPSFDDINWMHGFFGEKEGVEPSFMWREPGTPVPMGAMFLNTAVLFYLLFRFAGPKLGQGLKKRKHDLMEGMDQARKMKEDAEDRLDEYEAKLEKIDADIEAVKQQIREVGNAERDRVLRDAGAKRVRIERDAKLLIEQELKAARETLLEEAARAAVAAARETIQKQLNDADEQRILAEYLKSVSSTKGGLRGQA